MLELNIQELKVNAKIKFSLKPEGHIFAVRRMTQGDELKLSELYRKRSEVLVKANELQKQALEETKKDKPDFDKVEADTKKLAKEIEKLEEQVTKVRASVFDDGTTENELGIALYRELSEDMQTKLIDHIIDGKALVNVSSKKEKLYTQDEVDELIRRALENKPDGDAA